MFGHFAEGMGVKLRVVMVPPAETVLAWIFEPVFWIAMKRFFGLIVPDVQGY